MRAVSGDSLRAQIQSFQPDCESRLPGTGVRRQLLGPWDGSLRSDPWAPGMGACGAALVPLGWESRAALGPLG